jgi:hypothetical protein
VETLFINGVIHEIEENGISPDFLRKVPAIPLKD